MWAIVPTQLSIAGTLTALIAMSLFGPCLVIFSWNRCGVGGLIGGVDCRFHSHCSSINGAFELPRLPSFSVAIWISRD